MKNVRICISYISNNLTNSLNCYFIDEKSSNVLLLYKNIITNINFAELKASDYSMIALKISDTAKKQDMKINGKVTFFVSSKDIFSLINVFPSISRSKIEKFVKRDMEDSFTDYEKRLTFNENIHSDGKSGYIHNIHLCPEYYFDGFEAIAKNLHLPLGTITSPDLVIDSIYDSRLKKEYRDLIFINIDENITTVNLFINGLDTDSITSPCGYMENIDTLANYIARNVLAITAKHEFTTENTFVQKVMINCQSQSVISTIKEKLDDYGLFDVSYFERPYDLSTFAPNKKYTYKKYKKALFSKGFTLVEVVVSLAIFSIVSALGISAIAVSSGLPAKSEKIVRANNLISNIGEIYRADTSENFFKNYYSINGVDFEPEVSSNITEDSESYSYVFYFDNSFKLIPASYSEFNKDNYNFTYKMNCVNYVKDATNSEPTLSINQFSSIDNQENLIKDNGTIQFRG